MACELQPVAQAAQTALRAARTSLRPRLSICEINHEDKELPQQLLCAVGESSATYIGVQYQKGGGARALLKKFRQELLPHIEQPPCPIGQCELLSGPPARTTWRGRGALQRPAESDCDGDIVALLLERADAIAVWRALLGPGDPAAARREAPLSLRARFGSDRQRNAAHGADSGTAARREIELLFGEAVT